ncbi:MAG TPA: FGGY family carbohydrate kinase [Saprospiraceae bacterium]|nr:FGGY family carbohydrate kinase [Saprospiraceae bacterium]
MNHCLVFDIGKTNKKVFVFDERYQIVFESTSQFFETIDDDGHAGEDIDRLKSWVQQTARELQRDSRFHIKAVNCTTYGASLVHLDAELQPVTPLYNYLKPFPADLQDWFLAQYGGVEKLSLETASPLLGHLNSGLQLLWLKHHKPHVFQQIKYSLHLPQWVALLLGGSLCCEMTSLGCHTMLWDFQKNDYHNWVKAEGLAEKFPPIQTQSQQSLSTNGIGLHDSSAALIPYLACFQQPFVLISTGTWCISLNPFNTEALSAEELAQDCLCYLTFEGKPVKAARFFGGHEYDTRIKQLASEYGLSSPDFFKSPDWEEEKAHPVAVEAYKSFMQELVDKQVASTRLAIGQSPVRRIFVDGGFSKNSYYMQLLAQAFPDMEVLAAEVAQATALGAALALHSVWNRQSVPEALIRYERMAG